MKSTKQWNLLSSCVLAALLLLPLSPRADLLVVTGANSPVTTLTHSQVSNVFLGKITSLPDGSIVTPIDQPDSSPLRDAFYLNVTNKSAAQAKANWAKLYFTGRGIPPREARNSDDLKRILNSTRGAIGYIEGKALDDSVRVVFVSP